MVMKNIILISLLGILVIYFSATTYADIYRSVDENGVVTYSDQPNSKSEAVTLPAANIAIQPTTPKKTDANHTENAANSENAAETKPAATEKKPYTTFAITSPKDQETFHNITELPISVSIDPALQKSDKLRYYFDDAPFGSETTNTTTTIPKVGEGKEILVRGSHTISVSLINEQGSEIMRTPTITVFLQYQSVINNSTQNGR